MAYITTYSLQWIRNNIGVVTNQSWCGLIINIETYQLFCSKVTYILGEKSSYDDKKKHYGNNWPF